MQFRSISLPAFIAAAFAVAPGCGAGPDEVDENTAKTRRAFTDDSGPNICDPAYWNQHAMEVADWCAQGADSEEEYETWTLCYESGYETAQTWCEQAKAFREQEKQLCQSGLSDPTTCPPSWLPGGGGDGTPTAPGGSSGGGGSCTWCDCYGEYYDYHGSVCGQTDTELIEQCYGSCA